MKIKSAPTLFLIVIAMLGGLTIPLPAAVPSGSSNDLVRQDDSNQNSEEEDENASAASEDQKVESSSSVCLSCIGSIQVGPTASGEALRILRIGYVLQPLTNACPQCLGIVVGPADLGNPSIVARLRAAYEAGHGVAVTNASPGDIRRLHDLLGHPSSAEPDPAVPQVDLAAFRRSQRPDGPFNFSSHIFLPRPPASTPPLSAKVRKQFRKINERLSKKVKRRMRREARKLAQEDQRLADSDDLKDLNRVFSDNPDLPGATPQATPCSDPNNSLTCLADQHQTIQKGHDSFGNSVTVINTCWPVRSFTNSADLYYISQETHYTGRRLWVNNTPWTLSYWNNSVDNLPIFGADVHAPNPTVEQPSPGSTMTVTEETSSVSKSISGSAGWNAGANQQQGANAGLNATVSGGISFTHSKTSIIPPVQINFVEGRSSPGETNWNYAVNQLPSRSQTIVFYNGWIWSIPWCDTPGCPSSYSSGQTTFQFDTQADLSAQWEFNGNGPFHVHLCCIPQNGPSSFNVKLTSKIPLPFGRTFALQPPVVTSVNPTSVNAGDTFTINGTGLYPSLVTAVLIGGTPLSQANFTTVSDTKIDVVAPQFTLCELGCPVVVQTAEGTSDDNVNISIIP